MRASSWLFKIFTLGTIAAGLNYVHYQNFHGKELYASYMLLFPYILSLALPGKWLSSALAVPISGALVLSLPLLVSFGWGFHTDPQQDFKLSLVLISIVAVCIVSIVTAVHHRQTIRGTGLIASLVGSLIYFLAAVQYAR